MPLKEEVFSFTWKNHYQSLPIKTINITTLHGCWICEHFLKCRWFYTISLFRWPSQSSDNYDRFIKTFEEVIVHLIVSNLIYCNQQVISMWDIPVGGGSWQYWRYTFWINYLLSQTTSNNQRADSHSSIIVFLHRFDIY